MLCCAAAAVAAGGWQQPEHVPLCTVVRFPAAAAAEGLHQSGSCMVHGPLLCFLLNCAMLLLFAAAAAADG
jgi:hypothetical protein